MTIFDPKDLLSNNATYEQLDWSGNMSLLSSAVKFFKIAMLLSADEETIRPEPGATANDQMVSVCTSPITSAQYQSPASSTKA